ncbi:tandem-95 repeat protein [Azonexus sp.]|uniref:tandem-95 repeat protein n=1 Tax=Azonexus sp. TaxID=1872668 RepID=UPI0035B445E9
MPTGYTLTAPDGTRYHLDTDGRISSVEFADGAQWIVSDAAIVAVTGKASERVDFIRDAQGRITRVSGPGASIAYRYDESNRLVQSRRLDAADMGTPYAYDRNGQLLGDTISANLGAAVNWASANAWQGSLTAGQTTSIAFAVRESELASSIKTSGAQGAVIVALSIEGAGTVEVTGSTVVGDTLVNGKRTLLLRVTEAGVKLIRLTGTGNASVAVTLAGDMDRDGRIDGNDSQAWEAAFANGADIGDLNGDGQVNAGDRQILYANYGWRANTAPVTGTTTEIKTHADLSVQAALDAIAHDFEGDQIFWRVLGTTHGTAAFTTDGAHLIFTPEAGYTGQATITVQADDGFATGAPIDLSVDVSSAKLLAIHLAPLTDLRVGEAAQVKATADFEDELGVDVSSNGAYLTVESQSLIGLGALGASPLAVDDNRDLVRATSTGPVLILVKRIDSDGRTVQAVATLNTQAAPVAVAADGSDSDSDSDSEYGSPDPVLAALDIYPGTLTLVPGGTRQIKVINDVGTAVPVASLYPTTVRYIVSDASIATVSDTGLITALTEGSVTVSVIHLASTVDEFGKVIEQVVGQTDVALSVQVAQLVDNDAATPAPQAVVVSADHGGAVSAATGETVLIGAGALAQDTSVAIERKDIADIQAAYGMPAPASEIFSALGGFHLSLGGASANVPLQVAIPVQGNAGFTAGDEVFFFRKGKVLTPTGEQDTWWLVDNGFISVDANGVVAARTASSPYEGMKEEGDYMVCRHIPGVIGYGDVGTVTAPVGVGSAALACATFGFTGASVSLAGAMTDLAILGILMSMSSNISVLQYHFGVPHFANATPQRAADNSLVLDIPQAIGPTKTIWGNVSLPNLSGATVADDGTVTFNMEAIAPDGFKGETKLRALLVSGDPLDIKVASGDSVTISAEDIKNAVKGKDIAPFAVGSVKWQLVRIITEKELSNGETKSGASHPFWGNTLSVKPQPNMAAVLTRSGVSFYREQKEIGSTLLDVIGQPNSFDGYLTGKKVQPVAYSGDLTRVYVAGNGKIYVIDTITYQLIETVQIPAGQNISSLAASGNLLIAGEGVSYGQAGNYRLLMIDMTPGLKAEERVHTIQGTGIEAMPQGVSGMAIADDGHTLVVAAPRLQIQTGELPRPGNTGNLYVIDLAKLDRKTGKMKEGGAPIKVKIPDEYTGRTPQVVTPVKGDPNRFLVGNISDYDRGLGVLTIERDGTGKVTAAKIASTSMGQEKKQVVVDRLDIQRAQSAVLINYQGVEYAIVGDDNYYWIDQYWKSMYEAPSFMFLPGSGGFVAYGGSASAQKVALGGKLGIVKDPFGKQGTPQYLGATVPLDGYGVRDLALSADGKVLLGQFISYGSSKLDATGTLPHRNVAWNVTALIQAAVDQTAKLTEKEILKKHITIPASALINLGSSGANWSQTGWPIGTAFSGDAGPLEYTGNMGDVITVDVKKIVACQILKYPPMGSSAWNALDKAVQKQYEAEIEKKVAEIGHVTVDAADWKRLTDTNPENNRTGMQVVTTGDKASITGGSEDIANLMSKDGKAYSGGSGIFYLVPNLTSADMDTLRRGNRIATDKKASFTVSYTYNGESYSAQLNVSATDFKETQGRVFFGDRPTDDPGYSTFTLNGEVSTCAGNISVLDVFRVEQRLKYLGYPAFWSRLSTQAGDQNTPKTPVEFVVDGVFGVNEELALRGFYAATHYTNPTGPKGDTSSGKKGMQTTTNNYPAARVTANDANSNLAWLNAYNAPHWVNAYRVLGISERKSVGSTDFQDGTDITMEVYATSWTADLLLAAKLYRKDQVVADKDGNALGTLNPQTGTGQKQIRINGLGASTELQGETHAKGAHSVGMGIDYGFTDIYIARNNQGAQSSEPSTVAKPTDIKGTGWSMNNAYAWANQLPKSVGNDQAGALRSFLSFYALTINDGIPNNGTWEDLKIVNDAAGSNVVRKSLFGSGTQNATQMFQNIWIGDPAANTYKRIRYILGQLGMKDRQDNNALSHGLTYDTQATHKNHFHVDVRPPALEPIKPTQQLVVQNSPAADEALPEQALLSDTIAEWRQAFGFEEEMVMFVPDIPVVPEQYQTILVAEASTAATVAVSKILTVGVCFPVQNTVDVPVGPDYGHGLNPAGGALSALDKFDGSFRRLPIDQQQAAFDTWGEAAKITLLEPPHRGQISRTVEAFPTPSNDSYFYSPLKRGDMSKDSAVFLVEMGGYTVKLIYTFYLTENGGGPETDKLYCGKRGTLYRIVDEAKKRSALDPAIFAESIGLGSGNALPGLVIQTADLAGSTLAQTTGTSITLDPTAAGYSWFIDYTPYLNNEYLPTSNPNLWVAKEGSEAAGKMDMLSVLLHEYGHALGLEHSADSNDYMAATLQPGVRRMPSSDELALMAKLVAEAKGSYDTPLPTDPITPDQPGAPLPSRSNVRTTRARISRYGTTILNADGSESQSSQDATQFAIVANPTLTDAKLQNGTGWESTGKVAIGNGAATLSETTSSQTRLNQAFVVGPTDKYLSFTLANIGLDDVDNAPDDAFEAALIDANSGASLLGTTGLTRNDAFLNLQADGSEHIGQTVTSKRNADGSRTYVVDLSGIAEGTAVNLSFDLIGFGAAGSHVTVRNIRLGAEAASEMPQLLDDSASTAEDQAVDIRVLDNDINAQLAGFAPAVLTGPSHGTLTLNTDGSFRYVPQADWSGSDSFSYQLSDGSVVSNAATVNITVTPVNDAPVAADLKLTTTEDTSLTIDLLSGAHDIDSTALTAEVVAGPAHGQLQQGTDGQWRYTPDADWFGTDSFTYRIGDGDLFSNVATVTLTVTAVNDAPVVPPLKAETDEDQPLALDLLAGVVDVDGDLLSVTIKQGPLHGQLIAGTNGQYTYTPDANWNGSERIDYEVSDGTVSVSASVLITVKPVNDAPVAADQAVAMDEDGQAQIDVLTGAQDVDGDTLSVRLVAGPTHGRVELGADGSFVYHPAADYHGDDSFTYALNDGQADSNIATVRISIAAVNDAPAVAPRTLTLDEDSQLVIDLLADATDVDGDVLSASITAMPKHGSLTQNADGTWTYVPAADWNGTDAIEYEVSDGQVSTSARLELKVKPVNDAPVITPIATTLLEDGSVVIDLLGAASDVDGDALTVTAGTPGHGSLVQNADGTWTYRPAADYAGDDSFDWRVSDGTASTQGVVRLTITAVNDAPVAADDSFTVDEDRSITLAVMSNDHDAENDTLTLRLLSQPAHGTLVQNADGSFVYTPAANWSGEDSFTYVVNDGQADSNVATARLIVNAVADAPTLVLTGNGGETRELFRTGWESAANASSDSTLVKQSVFEGWTLLTTPDAKSGGANGFEIWSTGDKMANASGRLTTVSAGTDNGKNWLELNNATGSMAQTLGIARSVDTVAGATYTLSLDLAGRLGYSADYTRIGIYVDGVKVGSDQSTSGASALNWQTRSFQFVGKGGAQTIRIVSEATRFDANGRGMMIDDIALSVVQPANTGLEDTPIRLSAISAALTDTDGSETLAITVEALPVGATLSDGTRSFTATAGNTTANVSGWDLGKLTLLPPQDYHGSFTLTVAATATEQANQAQARTEAALPVTVLPVNDMPTAKDETASLDEDGSVILRPLANGADVDGDALTLRIVSQPAHGTLTKNADGSYTYTPVANWSGEDSFTYVVNDGKQDSNVATMRLIVNAVADVPVLTLIDKGGASWELFRTGWESAANASSDSTLVKQTTLEGWTLVTTPDAKSGGANGFEIWSSGDKMSNASGRLTTVSAGTGNGKNWLELNNATGSMAQTLGIARSVDTVAGATYTLSLDLAGRLGYTADYTRIGIYVDGVKIGSDQSTSGASALNWQTKSFQFVGKGGAQTIRIVSEATKFDANGRGMMLDDIALSESLPANTGFKNTAIPLSTIAAALTDKDGSETLKVSIEDIPVGAVLSDGTRSFTATAGNTTADVSGWDLGKLSLQPAPDYSGSFTLKVVATSTEQANQSQASSEARIDVTVLAANGGPQVKGAAYQVEAGKSVTIDFASLATDADGDALTLALGEAAHGKLTRNADGSYRYTPAPGFKGSDSFVYSVSDGIRTASATITLSITGQGRRGHDHDLGCLGGGSEGRTSHLLLQSQLSCPAPACLSPAPVSSVISVDWNAAVPSLGQAQDPAWLSDYFLDRCNEDKRSLAEITGLRIKR